MLPPEFMSHVWMSHVVTATAVIDIDGTHLVTDPAFDQGPRDYEMTVPLPTGEVEIKSRILKRAKMNIRQLPVVDAVLLSHEDHVDNLDETGRQLLIGRHVVTTPDGASKLAEYPGVVAIRPWETIKAHWGGIEWTVTGVPCLHGPVGEVTGFLIHKASFGTRPDGRLNVIYFNGDTLLLEEEIKKVREKYHVVIALLNLGNAMAPWEPEGQRTTKITMSGDDAVKVMNILEADILVPMHYDEWPHFTEGEDDLKRVFESAGIADKVVWLSGEKKMII